MTQLPNGPLVGGQCKPKRQSCTIYSRGCTPHSGATSLCIELCNDILSIKFISILCCQLSRRIIGFHQPPHFWKTILFRGWFPPLQNHHFLRFGLISSVSRPLSTEDSNDSPMDLIPECLQPGVNDFLLGFREGINYMFNTYSTWWLNQPIWKIWIKMGIFPSNRGENKKSIWNHHLDLDIYVICFT